MTMQRTNESPLLRGVREGHLGDHLRGFGSPSDTRSDDDAGPPARSPRRMIRAFLTGFAEAPFSTSDRTCLAVAVLAFLLMACI